jgi:hypothetical protein
MSLFYLLFLCIWFPSSLSLFPASGCYDCMMCSLLYLYRIVVRGEGRGVYCYFVKISYSASNTGLRVSICVSFMCKFSLLVLFMWYRSSLFKYLSFLPVVIMSIVSVIVPYACAVIKYLFKYLELLLLILMSCVFFVSGIKCSSRLSKKQKIKTQSCIKDCIF